MNRSRLLQICFSLVAASGAFWAAAQWRMGQHVLAASRQVAFTAHSVIVEFPGTSREVKHAERMVAVMDDGSETVTESLKGRPMTEVTRRTITPEGRTTVEVSPLAAKVSWWQDKRSQAVAGLIREEKRQNECAVPRRHQVITQRGEYLGYPAVRIEEPRKPLNDFQIETIQWLIPSLDCFQAEISSKTYDRAGAMVGEMLTRAVEIRKGSPAVTPVQQSYQEVKPSVLQRMYEDFVGVERCSTCGRRREQADIQYEKRQQRP